MRWAWWALLLAGCAAGHPPLVPVGEVVGRDYRPYAGLPWYLMPQQGPLGPAGRWDERYPVALARRIERERPLGDQLRIALDAVDEAAVDARGSHDFEELRLAIANVAPLVRTRDDLTAEVQEMAEAAQDLGVAPEVRRDRLLDRILEVTDLMRMQLSTEG
jgi:hypothetical protein